MNNSHPKLLATEGEEVTEIPQETNSFLDTQLDLTDLRVSPSKFQLEELNERLNLAVKLIQGQRVSQLSDLCRTKDLEIVGLEQRFAVGKAELRKEKERFEGL